VYSLLSYTNIDTQLQLLMAVVVHRAIDEAGAAECRCSAVAKRKQLLMAVVVHRAVDEAGAAE
jgi:hypothetical protein